MLTQAAGIILVLSLSNAFAFGSVLTCTYNDQCLNIYRVFYGCSYGIFRYTCYHDYYIYYDCPKTADCTNNYGAWSTCSVSCTPGGTRTRTVTCTTGGGQTCTSTGSEACNTATPCVAPVDGEWNTWGSWTGSTACSLTCCVGLQTQVRTRDCPFGLNCGTGPTSESRIGTCGSNDDQCPAICSASDSFLPDTCQTCGTRFYTCSGAGAGVESACTGGLVWSQTFMSCVPANICTA